MKASEVINSVKTWWTANPASHEWVRGFALLVAGIIIGKVL